MGARCPICAALAKRTKMVGNPFPAAACFLLMGFVVETHAENFVRIAVIGWQVS